MGFCLVECVCLGCYFGFVCFVKLLVLVVFCCGFGFLALWVVLFWCVGWVWFLFWGLFFGCLFGLDCYLVCVCLGWFVVCVL